MNNTYKWFKNDVEIPNSNSPSYSITAVSKNDAGSYHVVISNSCTPQTMSRKALLAVNEAPFILNQPEAQTVDAGANASFTVEATNATGYQWRKNNNNLAGKIASTLSLTNVQLADSGNYDCVVSNDCGKDTSIAVRLTVEPIGAGPLLTFSTNNIDFGVVIIDSDKDTTLSTLIKNSGTTKLDVTGMSISGKDSAEFSIAGAFAPFSLEPNETKSISLRFSPVSGGNQTAVLRFTSNSNKDTSVVLTGFGGVVTASVSKPVLNFDTTITNIPIQNSFSLNNTGNVEIEILQMEITGSGASFFNVESPATPFTIESGGSQDVVVSFNPVLAGLATAQMNIFVRNMTDSIAVMLNGIAVISGVEDSELLKGKLSGYPNPSANAVYITFETTEQKPYRVAIYDLLGNLVKTYDGTSSSNGINTVRWDGTDTNGNSCGTGAYLCVLDTKGVMRTMRLNIIR
ncbi:MAG: hypothetical protein A2X63_01680 [Ignavibacteria bacterium GWA2_35_8]|nr:MAG: hypothetical protein A2X63_01680 [Ignavibacteria bacterium GWA2_35_8]